MIIVDQILQWARERGYTAVYGSAEQVNEMLNNTPFADSKDGTAVVMHLVTASETVDGHDRAVMAVYFASLCDFDFDGESLLPEQERLKNIGKELLNDIRTGNVMTYSDPRWQYGYDDYAENVCWVCLRVTLTASAADCVPVLPPAPPPGPEYDIFCPQVIRPGYFENGMENPLCQQATRRYSCSIATPIYNWSLKYILWIGSEQPTIWGGGDIGDITEANITAWKSSMQSMGRPMTQETENWLRERLGYKLHSYNFTLALGHEEVLAAYSATHFESKPVTVI